MAHADGSFNATPRAAFAAALLATIVVAPLAWIIWSRLRASILVEGSPSVAQIEQAIRLDPSNDLYLILLAQRREELGGDAMPDWRRAIQVNPRRGLSLTQAAVAAEVAGDAATAEQFLLQAERFNRLWLPRWSLANFYSRNGRPEELFRAARLALERAWPDQLPLLRLCRQAGASDEMLLSRIMPPYPRNLAALIFFLIEEQALERLPDAAKRFLEASRAAGQAESDSAPVISTAVTALLTANRADDAVSVWNAAFPSPWTSDAPLINADLNPPVQPPGLDWLIPAIPGMETNRGLPPRGIKFTFSGLQPESAVLLEQTVVLAGERTWTLAFEFQTRNLTPVQSGLSWSLTSIAGSEPLKPLSGAIALSSEEWTPAAVSWSVPAGQHLYRLAFTLRRPAGQVRPEGELFLRNLSLRSDAPAR